MSSPCRWALAAGVAALVLIVLPRESLATHVDASGDTLPHASVKVWDGLANGLGSRPNAAVADTAGITGHVATNDAPLTIVNVYRQTGTNPYRCGAGAAGLVFWNPATNVFKCYAVAGGQPAAIDVNRSTGDTWVSNPTNGDAATGQLWVNLQGTDSFRGYVFGIGAGIWGVLVDPATSDVWFTQRLAGKISRLDPATGSVTSWTIGGRPQRLARDAAGRLYATVQAVSADQIVRLDPPTNTVTRWTVPGALSLADDGERMADGIAIDADGGVWFSETLSASQAVAIARLGPGPDGVLGTADDEITEFTKPGLSEPLATATVGSDAPADFPARNLQVFATEGAGNAVTVVTGREAVGTVTVAPASASTLLPAAEAPLVKSFSRTPLITTIVPATAVVDGLDGAADLVGDTKTAGPDGIPGNADDERIPGILRFPFGTIGAFPSGMTEIIGGNRVYGTFRDSGKLFELTSGAVIATPSAANQPPVALCQNQTVPADDACAATVSVNAGSYDPDGGPVSITQSPASFTGVGASTATLTVTDDQSATATCTAVVTVEDRTAPGITCPAPQTVECTNRAGTATVRATATDTCDPNVAATCQTPAGGSYPLGATSVSCGATDAEGNSGSCATTVTVVDTLAPSISCSAPITVECTSPGGTAATVSASATDQCDGVVLANCATPAVYALEVTAVVCSATDAAGHTGSCSTTVQVVDTAPPSATCVPSVNPSGKHVPAASGPNQDGFYRVGASDLCTASGGIVIALGSTMLANGETIKITQTPGASGVRLVNTMGPLAIKHFHVGPGDAVVIAQDASGNQASVRCPVPPETRDE